MDHPNIFLDRTDQNKHFLDHPNIFFDTTVQNKHLLDHPNIFFDTTDQNKHFLDHPNIFLTQQKYVGIYKSIEAIFIEEFLNVETKTRQILNKDKHIQHE